MGILVLVRHGESRWNVCNRFTGWVDVPLSRHGIEEAERCAAHCARYDYTSAFTSRLARAQETALIILSQQQKTGIFQHSQDPRYRTWIEASNHCDGGDIPVFASPALNERYYGDLQGMSKDAANAQYGKDHVFAWRRSYHARPPGGESLEDTYLRTRPYLVDTILPRVHAGQHVLLTAHGNTLRAIIKHFEHISDANIPRLDLPEAEPLVYETRGDHLIRISGEYTMERPLR